MIRSGDVQYHDDLEPFLVDINLVRPHPDNPSSGDVEAIMESIEVSGMYRPVYVQRSSGFVLAGNTTYAACLGLRGTQIPVVWLDVNDEQALRILLGDNELARLAIVDQGLLQPLLDQLLESELKLLGSGYSEPPPPLPPREPELSYTVHVNLTGDEMASWFDIPGDDDRARLQYLLELR